MNVQAACPDGGISASGGAGMQHVSILSPSWRCRSLPAIDRAYRTFHLCKEKGLLAKALKSAERAFVRFGLGAVRHSLEVEVDEDVEAVEALAQDIRVLRPDDRNRAEVGADELVVGLDRVLFGSRFIE